MGEGIYATPAPFSGLEQYVLSTDPQAAFGRFLEPYRGRRKMQDFLASNYDRYRTAYLSQAARSPLTTFLDYLKNDVNPEHDYMDRSPQARGERPNSFVGRMRWVGSV